MPGKAPRAVGGYRCDEPQPGLRSGRRWIADPAIVDSEVAVALADGLRMDTQDLLRHDAHADDRVVPETEGVDIEPIDGAADEPGVFLQTGLVESVPIPLTFTNAAATSARRSRRTSDGLS